MQLTEKKLRPKGGRPPHPLPLFEYATAGQSSPFNDMLIILRINYVNHAAVQRQLGQ